MAAFRQRQRQVSLGFAPVASRQVPLAFHAIFVAFPVPFLHVRRGPSGETDAET
jgi:hypothetical protein